MPNQSRSAQIAWRIRRVFPNAAGEDDDIRSVQKQQISAEIVPYCSDEHLEGLPCLGTTLVRLGFNVAEVVVPAQSQQAGTIGQIVEQLLQCLAGGSHQGRQSERIELAHAVVVRQTALG